jgi:hypothetical protein
MMPTMSARVSRSNVSFNGYPSDIRSCGRR